MVIDMNNDTCIEELINGLNMGKIAIDHLVDKIENRKLKEIAVHQRKSDDAKIAKMLTEGSNQAIMTMTHLLNKEENVDPKIKAFADDFEDISKRYIEELKEFL